MLQVLYLLLLPILCTLTQYNTWNRRPPDGAHTDLHHKLFPSYNRHIPPAFPVPLKIVILAAAFDCVCLWVCFS